MMPATPRVMVVDDDDDIRTLVCLVLESEGYQAIPARDGLEALEVLDGPQLPSLILLDIMMPRMDGEELVRALRASPQLRTIPVVIMSGHNNAREKSRTSCVRGCLVKPVDVDILLRAVQEFSAMSA
jgi:two-component system, chemotaxis family, chemotaxis protein CheY